MVTIADMAIISQDPASGLYEVNLGYSSGIRGNTMITQAELDYNKSIIPNNYIDFPNTHYGNYVLQGFDGQYFYGYCYADNTSGFGYVFYKLSPDALKNLYLKTGANVPLLHDTTGHLLAEFESVVVLEIGRVAQTISNLTNQIAYFQQELDTLNQTFNMLGNPSAYDSNRCQTCLSYDQLHSQVLALQYDISRLKPILDKLTASDITITGTLNAIETIGLTGSTYELKGTITIFGPTQTPITVDTGGLANPNIIQITDPTIKTVISIDNILQSPETLTFIPINITENGYVTTFRVNIVKQTIDIRPSVAISASKLFSQDQGNGQTMVTVQIPMVLDNTLGPNSVIISLVSKYLEGSQTNNVSVQAGQKLAYTLQYNFITTPAELQNSRGLTTADSGTYHTERVFGTSIDPIMVLQPTSVPPPAPNPTPSPLPITNPPVPTPTPQPNPTGNPSPQPTPNPVPKPVPVTSGPSISPIVVGIALAGAAGFALIMASGGSKRKVTV